MWEESNNQLKKTFAFKNFAEAFAFMTRVAFLAEKNGTSSKLDQCLQQSHHQFIDT
jgi:pterin-4a-carbinolamine dehydratase